MQPVKEKLNELKSNWGLGAGLTLMEIFDYDKLLIVTNRLNCYQITEEEKLKIQAFPFGKVTSRIRLSFEVCCEIDTNISDYIETPFHLKNYLQAVVDDIYYITDTIRGLNYIDELEKIGGFIYHNPFAYNETQIDNSRLLVDFFKANLTNYQNYQMVLDHAITCQEKQGFLTPANYTVIENSSNIISENSLLTTNQEKQANYCISKGQIVDLYDLLETEKVIEPMNATDFLKCFDLNNTPIKHPAILYKKMFVFALSLVDGMNSGTALKNFGITNYDKNKSDLIRSPIPKNKRVTENKIISILKPPVKVISK